MDAAVIQKGFEYLKGFAPETILTAVLFSMIGYFNGNNKTLWVMINDTGTCTDTSCASADGLYHEYPAPNASLTNIGIAAPTSTVVGIVLNIIFFFSYE